MFDNTWLAEGMEAFNDSGGINQIALKKEWLISAKILGNIV